MGMGIHKPAWGVGGRVSGCVRVRPGVVRVLCGECCVAKNPMTIHGLIRLGLLSGDS
jgi:hypothetical protein